MNFWEARQAALEGKTVQHTGAIRFTSKQFLAESHWSAAEINTEWEIVEGPKRKVAYRNLYFNLSENPYFGAYYDTREKALKEASFGSVGVIEIITDENGQLISARNV